MSRITVNVYILTCVTIVTRKALTRGHTDHFRLVLRTFRFQFRFDFPPHCRNWFSQFHSFTFCPERNIFLPWPWTLTYDLDLRTWHGDGQAEKAGQISRSKVISFESYHPNTNTHTQQTECSTRTTMWSVNTAVCCDVQINLPGTENSWEYNTTAELLHQAGNLSLEKQRSTGTNINKAWSIDLSNGPAFQDGACGKAARGIDSFTGRSTTDGCSWSMAADLPACRRSYHSHFVASPSRADVARGAAKSRWTDSLLTAVRGSAAVWVGGRTQPSMRTSTIMTCLSLQREPWPLIHGLFTRISYRSSCTFVLVCNQLYSP